MTSSCTIYINSLSCHRFPSRTRSKTLLYKFSEAWFRSQRLYFASKHRDEADLRPLFHSNIRQVPDNQEVFLDINGFSSLTFDLIERVNLVATDKEALEYHFADIIAEDDSKNIWSISEKVELPKFA